MVGLYWYVICLLQMYIIFVLPLDNKSIAVMENYVHFLKSITFQ